jgi:hypothetical protein
MKKNLYMNASVLPTVLVLVIIMLLMVMGIINTLGNFSLFRYRTYYNKTQRSYIESGFVLYNNAPTLSEKLNSDSSFVLFEENNLSKIYINRYLWGLYEIATISNHDKTISETRMIGLKPEQPPYTFYYSGNNAPVYLAGNTTIEGNIKIPMYGYKYTQMQSRFFSGREIEPGKTSTSEKELPAPGKEIKVYLDSLFKLKHTIEESSGFPDSLINKFSNTKTLIISTQKGVLRNTLLKGNIILLAKELDIEKSAQLEDIVIIADKIVVEDGFKGVVQLLAKDTVLLKKNITLQYPSGVYIYHENKKRHVSLGDSCIVEGYVIVDGDGEVNVTNANYSQAVNSTVKGLVFVNGIALFRGTVNGSVILKEAVYYSREGYYDNTIVDVTIRDSCPLINALWLYGNKYHSKKTISDNYKWKGLPKEIESDD